MRRSHDRRSLDHLSGAIRYKIPAASPMRPAFENPCLPVMRSRWIRRSVRGRTQLGLDRLPTSNGSLQDVHDPRIHRTEIHDCSRAITAFLRMPSDLALPRRGVRARSPGGPQERPRDHRRSRAPAKARSLAMNRSSIGATSFSGTTGACPVCAASAAA